MQAIGKTPGFFIREMRHWNMLWLNDTGHESECIAAIRVNIDDNNGSFFRKIVHNVSALPWLKKILEAMNISNLVE
jgi:hypothetical protein